ncbi:voltage-gated monoatomic cation channel TMEM109 isoform X1 [Engraulis encrasicolus]|uniref:voltage-gated monoatomic cation channel TMEM109 isoform X1 n=1 Tax=Engraulis encrasicolus TaxID=184585 RepID=UPI002FCFD887
MLNRGEMVFQDISNRAASNPVKFFMALLCASAMVVGCHGQAVPTEKTSAPSPPPPPPPTAAPPSFQSLVTETGEVTRQYVESIVGTNVVETAVEDAVEYLESVFGPDNIYTVAMFLGMLLQFVSEGAASGLNVIAVYVSEILRATGFSDKLPFPHFTPEGVALVAKWAVLALIGYWLLSLVLRLAVSVLRRVFWLVKAVATLWLFGLIVGDTRASTDVTSMRLAFLVLGYVVIGLATGGKEGVAVESRLNALEGKVKAIEKKKME